MNKLDIVNVGLLSKREREVASYAADGFANKLIARKLNITEGTVKIHLHRVYQKLGIKGRSILTSLAAETDCTESSAAKHDCIVPLIFDREIGHPEKLTLAVGSDVKFQRRY